MLTFLYYALMLLVGFVFYRHGQKLLRQGYRDRNGEPTQGMVGPVGFLVLGAVGCYLLFALLRLQIARSLCRHGLLQDRKSVV